MTEINSGMQFVIHFEIFLDTFLVFGSYLCIMIVNSSLYILFTIFAAWKHSARW